MDKVELRGTVPPGAAHGRAGDEELAEEPAEPGITGSQGYAPCHLGDVC
jgi:hypothetical protein